ncbi:hypothetical protein KCP70_01340 [Salmonella enterica subsp. enterica]|nr:hypothetical protein KCP70_01340 [Salmonella enterica subsp. enterica]
MDNIGVGVISLNTLRAVICGSAFTHAGYPAAGAETIAIIQGIPCLLEVSSRAHPRATKPLATTVYGEGDIATSIRDEKQVGKLLAPGRGRKPRADVWSRCGWRGDTVKVMKRRRGMESQLKKGPCEANIEVCRVRARGSERRARVHDQRCRYGPLQPALAPARYRKSRLLPPAASASSCSLVTGAGSALTSAISRRAVNFCGQRPAAAWPMGSCRPVFYSHGLYGGRAARVCRYRREAATRREGLHLLHQTLGGILHYDPEPLHYLQGQVGQSNDAPLASIFRRFHLRSAISSTMQGGLRPRQRQSLLLTALHAPLLQCPGHR